MPAQGRGVAGGQRRRVGELTRRLAMTFYGFAVTGNVGGVCPECGTAAESVRERRPA